MDLCVEVFVTDTGASSSSSAARKAAEARTTVVRASPPNPLRATMQSLCVPIGSDIDASNIAEAQTRLDEDRQRLLDLTGTLAATQRRLDSAQLERNAAYGFTPDVPRAKLGRRCAGLGRRDRMRLRRPPACLQDSRQEHARRGSGRARPGEPTG